MPTARASGAQSIGQRAPAPLRHRGNPDQPALGALQPLTAFAVSCPPGGMEIIRHRLCLHFFFSHLQTQDRQTEKKKILLSGSGPTMQPSTEWLSISCFPARVANNSTRCRRPVEAFPHSLARRTWRTKTSPTVQPQSLLLVCIRRSSDFLPSDTFPPLRFPISTSKNLANPYNT